MDTYDQKAQQPVTMRTYEGTASQSRNDDEDPNAPIAVNQGARNSLAAREGFIICLSDMPMLSNKKQTRKANGIWDKL